MHSRGETWPFVDNYLTHFNTWCDHTQMLEFTGNKTSLFQTQITWNL